MDWMNPTENEIKYHCPYCGGGIAGWIVKKSQFNCSTCGESLKSNRKELSQTATIFTLKLFFVITLVMIVSLYFVTNSSLQDALALTVRLSWVSGMFCIWLYLKYMSKHVKFYKNKK